jgi:hypothetical protein
MMNVLGKKKDEKLAIKLVGCSDVPLCAHRSLENLLLACVCFFLTLLL